MNLLRAALQRPYTVLVLALALAIGGWLAIQRMARDIFPPLGIPTIYVAQPYGGMDPAQMEGYLTYYYEYHFLYITGIEHVESKSIQGASIMKLQFHPGTDMSQAMAETVSYVNRARAFMPAGAPAPFVTRFDAGSVAVGQLVFSTDNPNRTVGEMQDAALNMVRPLFATLPGVSAPPPFGGSARTILINLKPERLRALNLSPDDVVNAMSATNLVSPSGNMSLGDTYPIVPVNSVPKNVKDLELVPLRSTPDGAVLLRDIATVDDGSDLVTSYALVNGLRTVYIPVTKRADASTLAVVDLVKASLPKFQAVVPPDVKVSFEFDQSPVVKHAISDLVTEALLGAALTGLMVLVFLRDLRSVIIVVVNIPLAILSALFGLWLCGYTVNLMTLSGLALAVGILVDESTVALENIHTHLSHGRSPARAALDATAETALPRLLAMLCVVSVFLPTFFMTAAARSLFLPTALAVGFSMIASYLLSSTLVPVLSAWWLNKKHTHGSELALWRRAYAGLVRPLVTVRWVLVPAVLAGAVLVILSFGPFLGTEIFPRGDLPQFAFRMKAPTGNKLENTEALALKALALVKRETGEENVTLTMGLVGVHAPNYPVNLIHLWNSGPEEAHLSVQLNDKFTGSTHALIERLRTVFATELPTCRFSFEPSDIVNRVMSFGTNTPIEIAVNGPSLPDSIAHAEKILAKLKEVPFLRDVHIPQSLDYPSVEVQVDRERAGLLGVRMSDVTRSLVAATTSSRFTQANYWADPKSGVSYNLQVQIPQAKTSSLEELRNTPVTANHGTGSGTVLLRNVAAITPGSAIGTYERYNMARVVSIQANLEGKDLGSAAEVLSKIPEISDKSTWPAKTNVAIRGQAPVLEELLDGLENGLVFAIGVILLLLIANFQSPRLALVVLSCVPVGLAGVVLILFFTGTTLNLQSYMGAIMTVGVSVANSILLVSFAERARMMGASAKDAAVQAAQERVRPILMTSCAMIAGMIPMALGLGGGGDQTAPLGRAVVGGLALATVATLFVVPAVFAMAMGRRPRLSASLDPDDPLSPHHAPAKHLL
ncbi:MAG TPA: efflux RND transporter permease subunit [Candidatus Saccharimonadia bacterium]|nr:efflux RND transporter permease subunit [Candidatus Saccharimonadia bacterium]